MKPKLAKVSNSSQNLFAISSARMMGQMNDPRSMIGSATQRKRGSPMLLQIAPTVNSPTKM